MLALALLTSAAALACPQNLANGLDTPATARQLITVEAASARTTYAELRTWRRPGRCWLPAGGPFTARVGRNGLSADRHEGDGTTPAGTFRIGATMYGNAAESRACATRTAASAAETGGTRTRRSRTYNSFQHVACGSRPPFTVTTPGMWEQPRAYPHLAVIEYNMRPVVPGRGSGIFLHAQTGRATNGCVSLRLSELVAVLRWLRPADAPVIAIGTRSRLRS